MYKKHLNNDNVMYLKKIQHEFNKPITNNDKFYILSNKKQFILDRKNDNLLYTIINHSADTSWVDFYFDNFSFSDVANSTTAFDGSFDTQKYLNKYISLISCKKDKYSFYKFLEFIGPQDLSFNNFLSKCAGFAFYEGVIYFYHNYPQMIVDDINDENNPLIIALTRSGSSNKECIAFIAKNTHHIDYNFYKNLLMTMPSYFLDKTIAYTLLDKQPQFKEFYKEFFLNPKTLLEHKYFFHPDIFELLSHFEYTKEEVQYLKDINTTKIHELFRENLKQSINKVVIKYDKQYLSNHLDNKVESQTTKNFKL